MTRHPAITDEQMQAYGRNVENLRLALVRWLRDWAGANGLTDSGVPMDALLQVTELIADASGRKNELHQALLKLVNDPDFLKRTAVPKTTTTD